jgi:hypothetical protein
LGAADVYRSVGVEHHREVSVGTCESLDGRDGHRRSLPLEHGGAFAARNVAGCDMDSH